MRERDRERERERQREKQGERNREREGEREREGGREGGRAHGYLTVMWTLKSSCNKHRLCHPDYLWRVVALPCGGV